jgi:hypothetical protein
MSGSPERVAELLGRASAARASGAHDVARLDYLKAFQLAQHDGDVDAMATAALGLAAGHRFGTHPGRVPAFLHATYLRADGPLRIRLAIALARVWGYANAPDRAVPFAQEAVAAAHALGDPLLSAQALDALLVTQWGPDQFVERARSAERLEGTVAHLTDVDVRLAAYLWRLTTALESLEAVAVRRQLRALDALAEETGVARVRFFAASRRGMHSLLIGDVPTAQRMAETAVRAGAEAGEPDTEAIQHTLAAGIARVSGDAAALAREAKAFEAFGTAEGVPSIGAEAASLWLAAGSPERARALLDQLTGGDLTAVPRDVDWLLVVATLTEVAAGTGARELAATGVKLLEPYAGRGIVNAGAVAFLGTVDDCLRTAASALGRDNAARRWGAAAGAGYQRLGATWWLSRVQLPAPAAPAVLSARLVPTSAAVWTIGVAPNAASIRDLKGLHYLRWLIQHPGVAVSAVELSERVAGHPHAVQSGIGALADRPALQAYRRRLAELDDELDEARAWADEGRRIRTQAERDALVEHLAEVTGWHGRGRIVGATAERARVAVRKSIAAAIRRIEADDPVQARLLRDTIHTGASCSYEPDPTRPVRWLVDPLG